MSVYYLFGKGVGAYIVPDAWASAFRMCEIGWSGMLDRRFTGIIGLSHSRA
jgi:hypothetical protein